ncbi:MAG: dihydrofolate reductase [Candidatus Pseudothioglobus sp.]
MPWHLPAEYASFDSITRSHAIIMGRRSYEDHQCALPLRLNIVVSRQQDYSVADGVILVSSLEAAIVEAQRHAGQTFIIGGVSLILASLPQATAVFETVVDAHIDGDTFLPVQNFSQFSREILLQKGPDTDHLYGFTVYRYQRLS